MALKMVKGSIDRMFDKNLQDLVRGIRNHKEDEVRAAPVWGMEAAAGGGGGEEGGGGGGEEGAVAPGSALPFSVAVVTRGAP